MQSYIMFIVTVNVSIHVNWQKFANLHYHDLCNLLWIITVKVKFEGHHLPVVSFQLALGYSVTHVRDLQHANLGVSC